MVLSKNIGAALLACMVCSQSAVATTLLVQFTSPDCGPCRAMRPTIERLVAEGHQVRMVDVSTRPDLAQQFRVTSWPTFLVLVDGRERARLVGATSHAQLVEMVQKANAIAGARGAAAGAVSPGDSPATLTSGSSQPSTFAAGPEEGRIVQIQDSTAPRPAAMASAPAAAATPSPAAASAPPQDAPGLIAATVRLKITDPDGNSTGTGTIVDAREGEALVLTCGHLFRSSGGKGPIELSLFTQGPQGAELLTTAPGVLIDFDLERDLALVRFSTSGPVAVAPIAPRGTDMQPGVAATSVGCNNGANPTVRATQITAVDRYVGHPNVEAAGAPVEGRSGGGLFNSEGRLVGVCYAADPQSDEGLYASLPSIYAKLDSLGLSKIYEAPVGASGASGNSVASQPSSELFQVRGQNPMTPASAPLAGALPGPVAGAPETAPPTAASAVAAATPAAAPAAPLTLQEQAALEEIRRRGVDSEVICIIRPRSPEGRSDVIKLSNASPAFVEALAGSQGQAGAAPAVAQAAGPGEQTSPILR